MSDSNVTPGKSNHDHQAHYGYRFRLDGSDRWLLWYGNDHDGVRVEPDGFVPTFRSLPDLALYARRHGITLASTPIPSLDLEAVVAWLLAPRAETLDCKALLEAWNLFTDVADSVGADLRDQDDEAWAVYDKLFWGNNLPAVTPAGRSYEAMWTPDEIERLRLILGEGLELLCGRIKAR